MDICAWYRKGKFEFAVSKELWDARLYLDTLLPLLLAWHREEASSDIFLQLNTETEQVLVKRQIVGLPSSLVPGPRIIVTDLGILSYADILAGPPEKLRARILKMAVVA
jgi:hypothetical protein